MNSADFNPVQFQRGQKHSIDLSLDPWVEGVCLPVVLVRGSRAGKTLVVTAGVHGDEYEGVRAILDAYQSLDPQEMTGDFLAVPVANPPAFWNGTRTSPLDQGNLARPFREIWMAVPLPRLRMSSPIPSSRSRTSFLDLHSAGVELLIANHGCYDASD